MQTKMNITKLMLLSFVILILIVISLDLFRESISNFSWSYFSGYRILIIIMSAIFLPVAALSILKKRIIGRNTDQLFSEAALAEGFKPMNLKECKESQKDLANIPYRTYEFRDLTSFCFALSFKKVESGRKTYLCSADRYYIIFEFPEKIAVKQSIFIKKFDNLESFEIYFMKGSVANSIQGFNATFVVNCIDCDNPTVNIPVSIQEYLKTCRGIYPLDRNLKFIFAGPAGMAVAVNDTGKKSDIVNLIRFSRELAGILENESMEIILQDEVTDKLKNLKQDEDL
jgi:hypothetical protein